MRQWRRAKWWLSGVLAAASLIVVGCARPDRPRPVKARIEPALFRNVAEEAGVRFRFENGARGEHNFIETNGSGCAWIDFDEDGRPDLLMLQCGPLPWERQGTSQPRNRLYHNLGNGAFSDVTAGSGLEDTGYSQGAAVGDVDGDGFDDLFVTAYGRNYLFHNEKGTGRFRDITRSAGLADDAGGPRWGAGAAFGDYNRDGKLDLYLCRYIKWSREKQIPCKNPLGGSSYCSPELYPPEEHALYRNNGDGTFSDVSRAAGIAGHAGRGLGVAWLDFDGDGWEDIFVANDLSPFFLWRNNHDGTFREAATESGVAYGDRGQLLSGMGIGVSDYDGDGREDLFVTVFSGQMNALYHAEGRGQFSNRSVPSGIGQASFKRLAFGCEFLDYDRDGWPDLLVGNGHVNEDISAYAEGLSYAESKSLLRNDAHGGFAEVKEGLGDLAVPHVTRGLAVADFDGRGHLGAAVNNQDGPPELLRYTGSEQGNWLAIRLHGTHSNPDGYHALITVKAGGRTLTREARSGSSYCSASDRTVYFGLGDAPQVDELRIRWYGSGTVTSTKRLAVNRRFSAIEGGKLMAVAAPGGARPQ